MARSKRRQAWGSLGRGLSRVLQHIVHGKRRGLVRKLLKNGNVDDIPGNTPRHIRWDYW